MQLLPRVVRSERGPVSVGRCCLPRLQVPADAGLAGRHYDAVTSENLDISHTAPVD